jgi:hypothetical protein
MRSKMLIYAIASLAVTLAALAMIAITYGWFAKQVTITSNDLAVGEITYNEAGSWVSPSTPIVPSQNLIATSFVLTNTSTITSQMRVKIEYTKYTLVLGVPTGATATFTGIDVDDHIDVSIANTVVSGFQYYSGYWYYSTDHLVTLGPDYVFAANSGAITLITSLSLDGDDVSIDYAGQTVLITITIQVKQADNVTWSTLTTYNFETGLPA